MVFNITLSACHTEADEPKPKPVAFRKTDRSRFPLSENPTERFSIHSYHATLHCPLRHTTVRRL